MPSSLEPDKMEPENASPLLRLPVEVKEEIASHLPAKDVGSLRLTCRLVNVALLNQFQLRFFQTRRVLLPSPKNLQRFADITEDPTMRTRMQNVVLVADPDIFQSVMFENPTTICRTLGVPKRYPESVSDLHPGGDGPAAHQDRATLTRAFMNLPNLKAVQIRNVQGEANSLNWGQNKPTFTVHPMGSFTSYLFSMTVAALADAGARPECLEILFQRTYSEPIDAEPALLDLAFHIPGRMELDVAGMLSGLQKLAFRFSGQYEGDNNALCLPKFLSFATQLVTLGMDFRRGYPKEMRRHVMDWLGRRPDPMVSISPVADLGAASPVQFPHLHELRLRGMIATPETMLNVLAKLGSQLHTFELSCHGLVDEENTINDRVNIWAPLLQSIAQHCNLREFEIRAPYTIYPDSGWRQRMDREYAFPLIYFRRPSGQTAACNSALLSGLDVSGDIADLADSVYTPWPEESDWLRDDQNSWGDTLSVRDGSDGSEVDPWPVEFNGRGEQSLWELLDNLSLRGDALFDSDDGEDDSEDEDEDGNGDDHVDGDGDESSDDSD